MTQKAKVTWMNYLGGSIATIAIIISAFVGNQGLAIASLVLFLGLFGVIMMMSKCPHCEQTIRLTGGSSYCPKCGQWVPYDKSTPDPPKDSGKGSAPSKKSTTVE